MTRKPTIVAGLVLLVMAGFLTGSAWGHGHGHDHDEVSHRIFVLDVDGGQLAYLDIQDHTIKGVEVLETGPYTEGMVSERGRFVALLDEPTQRVEVWSSGLVLEEHGDHYDLAALRPQLFWEHTVGRGPSLIGTGQQDFLIGNSDDHTTALLSSDNGIQTVFPSGSGPAAVSGHNLLAADASLRLADIYERDTWLRRATLRLPHAPMAVAVAEDRGVAFHDQGLEVLDLTTLEVQSFHGLWEEEPLGFWVPDGGSWAYVLTEKGPAVVDLISGQLEQTYAAHSGLWAVNQQGSYLAVVHIEDSEVHVFDIEEGSLRHTDTVAVQANASIHAITWAGRDFVVAAGNEKFMWAFDGRERDHTSLPLAPGSIWTAFIPEEDRVMDHDHDHDHHHHDHEDDNHYHDDHHDHHHHDHNDNHDH